MNTTKKLATATVAATALAGLGFGMAPTANASAAATKNFSVSFNQVCQMVGPFGQQTLPATVSGTVPTAVPRGQSFQLTNGKIRITIPAGLNAAAYSTGARSKTITFNTINLNNTRIKPAIKDITGAGSIQTARTAIPNGQASTDVAPKGTNVVTVPLTAGTTAGIGSLKTGSIAATFQLYSGSGAALGGPQQVTCAAQNFLLTTIKIT